MNHNDMKLIMMVAILVALMSGTLAFNLQINAAACLSIGVLVWVGMLWATLLVSSIVDAIMQEKR